MILTYSDCQKLVKLLRRHGYEVRFFITGEYGSERQRAHWNIILYSDKPLPAFSGWDQYGRWKAKAPFTTRFNWVRTDANGKPVYIQNGQPAWWWPHGFVHIDQLNVQNVKYVCKYVLKDFDANGKQGHKGQSKGEPGKSGPIGWKYFEHLAEKYVEQGLAPQTPEYRFPESRTREGEPIHYWLKGRSLELFLEHYIATWLRRWPERKRPKSALVDLFEEYGRVVNDENKMLIRQQFPHGEREYQIIAPYARLESEWEKAFEERHIREMAGNIEIYARDIRDAEDGEERQRQIRRAERFFTEQWYAYNHKHSRHWVKGKWQQHARSAGPCGCCAEPGSPDILSGGRGPGDGPKPQPGVGRPSKPDYGLGPVGRYNRDYAEPDEADDA
ncbi:MAG: hypothetical protein KJ944_19350 [Alphaproteobacteria bacterium]|nr:hypothetical protein [Alphaproteobacteria bacterium]MBU1560772.1 hypothetical protein [Alphaproteobacteria bacterium]MBU2304746.1 hypothetical protein [Alphaproteobacteria bacterium]MBU2370042.1 hypothetical protein [Alphaproteobacteria bacterium]